VLVTAIPRGLIYYLGRSSPGSKNFGLRISDCGFRNPHSTIRNGLRAKPALGYYFRELSRGAKILGRRSYALGESQKTKGKKQKTKGSWQKCKAETTFAFCLLTCF
jgi:hypothetical protein